jgi:hypothetical protein
MTREQRAVIATLRRARKLISQPERWTRAHFARDARGRGLTPNNADAVCFCAVGAIQRASGSLAYDTPEIRALGYRLGSAIPHWNDHPRRTHAQVLARFDRTIARLEAK